jgi:thiol-disulfide isomerase/thioredoxin
LDSILFNTFHGQQMARWTSAAIKMSRQVVIGLIVLVVLWLLYNVGKRYLKAILEPPKEPAPVALPSFQEADAVKFVPTTGAPIEVASDKTADAILSGSFGPAVVVFYADWCVHCKNMMDAYESAAIKASIPFVKVSGASAPVTGRKYGVTGYPTIFGVASIAGGLAGGPRRHNGPRTEASFLEFATALGGSSGGPQAVAADAVGASTDMPAVPAVEAAAVVPAPAATEASGAEIAVIPPTVHVTDS